MEKLPNQSEILSLEEHNKLIDQYTSILSEIDNLRSQITLRGETSHTEPLLIDGNVNEAFVDFGFTDQINDLNEEKDEIETRIAGHTSALLAQARATQPASDV